MAIYKDQASLRMHQFPGLESDLAASGFTYHALGQNLTKQSERVNGLAKRRGLVGKTSYLSRVGQVSSMTRLSTAVTDRRGYALADIQKMFERLNYGRR